MIKYSPIPALAFLVFCMQLQSVAQPAYTNPVYNTWTDSAVYVGSVPNYCGNGFDVKINIYKPIGDFNTKRPVAICVHGGAFTSSDDFNEYHLVVLAKEFAKRGYVGVSIDYREGYHLNNYGTSMPYPNALLTAGADWTNIARTYAADSAEIFRAIFRAQQDIKGVVRFMKGNHAADSTCTENVFLVGHSAGAIATLAAAFLDVPEKKPAAANVSSTVSNPAWRSDGFYDFFGNWVVTQINGPQGKDDLGYRLHNPLPFDYNAAACYTRPDLGDLNGTILTGNGYDATVLGVAALCGAVADTNIFTSSNLPALYLYHQPNDRVVDYNAAKPFDYLSGGYYPAPNSLWPKLYGSNWIKNKLSRIPYPGLSRLWTYDNSANDPLGLSTHDLLPNDQIVADSIARFFSNIIVNHLCPVVLPVDVRLTGAAAGSVNRLTIQFGGAGISNAQYSIERSADGIHFSVLSPVIITNNQFYQFQDPAPSERTFYRIKIGKADGTIAFSPVIRVDNKGRQAINIYPNPLSGPLITAEYFNTANACNGVLQIINATGQLIVSKNINIEKGLNLYQADCSTFAPGIYDIAVLFDDGRAVLHKKFLVQ